MNDIDNVRKYFPHVKEKIFLNHAGVSPLCTPVLNAIKEFLECRTLSKGDFNPESAKKFFAHLINAEPEEIALVPNTSTGLNVVANILSYPRGCNIVTADLEFPSVVYPWLKIRMNLNLEIRYVKNVMGKLRIEDFEKAVDDNTVAVVISHVEYGNGFRNNLEEISEIAHDHGAFLIVDACQSAGAVKIDVKRQNIDFLATSCYKWLLGPCGAGFLYVKKDLIKEHCPTFVGWASVKREIFETADLWNNTELILSDTASRFEIGTPSCLSYVGASSALKMILEYGIDRIEDRIGELIDYLIGRLEEEDFDLQTPKDPSNRSGIINFKISDPIKKVEELREKGVIVSARMNGIRVSPHFYNTKEEIEEFIEQLKKM